MRGRVTLTIERWQLALLLAVPVAWCWEIAWQVGTSVPSLATWFTNLGAALPGGTRLLIATARWWWLLAAAATLAAADVVRRREPGATRACVTFCVVLAGGLVLQAFAIAAVLLPWQVLVETVR